MMNSNYIKIIENAIKAPSGHNTQPWLFKVNNDSIEILPDMNKALPVVDPDNRELFISLGCAAENLCITASAMEYETEVIITEKDTILINLNKVNNLIPNPLYKQIVLRQTNRSIYKRKVIPDNDLNILRDIPLEESISSYFYENGTTAFKTIASFVHKGNEVQMDDPLFKNELKQWMRFNKKHQNKHNDGLSYAVFGAPNLPQLMAKRIISSFLNVSSQNKSDMKKIESSSHFLLFTSDTNTIKDWINLGRSLERILLKSTELGLSHAYLNQPNEIKHLAKEMSEILDISNKYPTILLRLGYGNKMPYSKRRSIESVII